MNLRHPLVVGHVVAALLIGTVGCGAAETDANESNSTSVVDALTAGVVYRVRHLTDLRALSLSRLQVGKQIASSGTFHVKYRAGGNADLDGKLTYATERAERIVRLFDTSDRPIATYALRKGPSGWTELQRRDISSAWAELEVDTSDDVFDEMFSLLDRRFNFTMTIEDVPQAGGWQSVECSKAPLVRQYENDLLTTFFVVPCKIVSVDDPGTPSDDVEAKRTWEGNVKVVSLIGPGGANTDSEEIPFRFSRLDANGRVIETLGMRVDLDTYTSRGQREEACFEKKLCMRRVYRR